VNSIYVAQGTYSPGDNENDSFVLPEGVSVYGGFPTGGCDFADRNPKRYQTSLTGYIDSTSRNTTVVTMGGETHLEGFTVREASFDGQGIFGSGADFSLKNCTIEHNEYYGIYIENGNVNLEWCTIRNNKSDGIYHQGEDYELIVENCWIRQIGNLVSTVQIHLQLSKIPSSPKAILHKKAVREFVCIILRFNPSCTIIQ